MTAPVIPTLSASTNNRKWVPEVNTGTSGAPIWTPIGGVKTFVPVTDDANREDDSRFSGGGFSSMTKTSAGWSATVTVARAPQLGNLAAYDVAQEFLRNHAEGTFGPANLVQIRFYEFDPAGVGPFVQAYSGYASVGWSEPGGAYNALSEAEISLIGSADGRLLKVTHPYPGTAAVPLIGSATPLALSTAGGQLVHIYGSGFTSTVATTGVKFAGTNATTWSVESDSLIIASTPAHTAGSGPILVTNATGPSTTGPTVTFS